MHSRSVASLPGMDQPAHPLRELADRPEVVEAAEAARAAVDALLAHRVLRRQASAVSAESALRGARASAALAGADISLAALRGLSGAATDDASRVVLGALRVSAELVPLAEVWQRAPLQALARLHVLAAADLMPAAELGRPAVAGPRLTGLAELVTGPAGVPAVVEAAVVHGELLALAPFPCGTGVVARAASRLVLRCRGLDPRLLTVPEVGDAESAERYTQVADGYRSGSVTGVIEWVVHCAQALQTGVREATAICEALLRSA